MKMVPRTGHPCCRSYKPLVLIVVVLICVFLSFLLKATQESSSKEAKVFGAYGKCFIIVLQRRFWPKNQKQQQQNQ